MCTCHDRRNSRNFFKLGAWRAARAAQPRACFCLFRSGAELRRPGCSKNYAIHWWLKHSYPVDGIVCQLINSYLLDSVLSERYPPCRQLGSVLQTMWSYKITTTRSTSKWEVCNLSPSTFALGLLMCGPIYVWAWVQFKLHFRSFPGFVKRLQRIVYLITVISPLISRTIRYFKSIFVSLGRSKNRDSTITTVFLQRESVKYFLISRFMFA